MAGDIGPESGNGSVPKPETPQTAGNSSGEKKTGHTLTFRKAIDRARESIQRRLGISREPKLSGETGHKVADAEGYRWIANEPKLLDIEGDEKREQEQYIAGLRENNDVHFGEAFDATGNPLPEYQAVYIKPKTHSPK